jgi:hypothetical protein
MIKYALICEARHEFESWFSDSQAFETQARRGLVECPHCGSQRVEKALMAPAVSTSRRKARNAHAERSAPAQPEAAASHAAQPMALLDDKQRAVRDMLQALHQKIAETTVDVGAGFVEEARRMHEGEAPVRAIRGKASFEQAKELWDEGVPVLPIPALPDERN